MARLPLLDPATAPAPAAAQLQAIAGERGQAFNVYRMLAHSPGTLERVYALAAHLWHDGALSPRLQELAILRVARLSGSDYEWARHAPLARRAGVSDEQLAALARVPLDAGPFDEVERAVLALAEEAVERIEASEAAVARVGELLGAQATVELLVLAGFYRMVAGMLRSLAVDGEAGDAQMPRPAA